MKIRVVSFMDPYGELFWLIKWGRKTPTHTSQTGWHHSLGKEFWTVQDWKKASVRHWHICIPCSLPDYRANTRNCLKFQCFICSDGLYQEPKGGINPFSLNLLLEGFLITAIDKETKLMVGSSTLYHLSIHLVFSQSHIILLTL